jgi:hypothetical protein
MQGQFNCPMLAAVKEAHVSQTWRVTVWDQTCSELATSSYEASGSCCACSNRFACLMTHPVWAAGLAVLLYCSQQVQKGGGHRG